MLEEIFGACKEMFIIVRLYILLVYMYKHVCFCMCIDVLGVCLDMVLVYLGRWFGFVHVCTYAVE